MKKENSTLEQLLRMILFLCTIYILAPISQSLDGCHNKNSGRRRRHLLTTKLLSFSFFFKKTR